MKAGILGSGVVGKVLAEGFLRHGHEVVFGTRNVSKLSAWVADNPSGKVGSLNEAAAFGDVIVLAVKGSAAADVLHAAGTANLAGKTVIDVTNPIDEAAGPPENGVLTFFTDSNESLMERLKREFPEAHFVKAFNSVGNAVMVNPHFEGGKPTMFICGNDESAKAMVNEILDQFGWEVADMGKASAARVIEMLCILWCIPGFLRNQWTHAFKLLK
jgi:8-hydroxy-5-deazaflavin:NADPH oxidoreductase